MSKKVEYVIRIGNNERYRHTHVRIKREILSFRLQMEIKIDNKWYPVVRYDTSHGYAHRDLINRKGLVVEKTPLFNQNYNSALTFAESDLKANWTYYKQQFLKSKNHE